MRDEVFFIKIKETLNQEMLFFKLSKKITFFKCCIKNEVELIFKKNLLLDIKRCFSAPQTIA